ncbi:MAG: hypothetical protein QOH41_1640 [Blastocatellia bacterium]|nr:hypothetical protein [Blastocatellia bacterium]
MILRYFVLGNLLVVIILISSWRYLVAKGDVVDASVIIVPPILFLSGLLVTVIWYWLKYSDNKLSTSLNRAPRHYLFSAIALVLTVICYITYGDLKDLYDALGREHEIGRFLHINPTLTSTMRLFQFSAWIGMFATIGTAVLGYLRPSDAVTVEQPAKKLDRAISVVLEERNKNEALASPDLYPELLVRLTSTVESNSREIAKLLNQSSIAAETHGPQELISDRIGSIRGRLIGELKDLAKRGNLNLTIGILTTVGAASALFWGLIATQPLANETQVTALVRHYVPRVSFAIFIEVFSFFFLRLYKSSLEDIKYYHNELTNLDSRLLALEIAMKQQSQDALNPILLGLLNTDRNYVLRSGESTVELEKVRADQQYMRNLIDTISRKLPDLGSVKGEH